MNALLGGPLPPAFANGGEATRRARGAEATRRALLVALPLVGLVWAGSGCLKPYCTSDTDCYQGQRCNLSANRCEPQETDAHFQDAGDAAAPCGSHGDCTTSSEPICDPDTNTCRPCQEGLGGNTECAAADSATPACLSGACVECIDSTSHCQGSEAGPICDPETHRCRPCGPGATGDGECLSLELGTPACLTPPGQCVECTSSALHCQQPDTDPICDLETYACRPCASHAECQAPVGVGICELETGRCLPEDEVIFVDAGASDCPGLGTLQSPFCVLQDGVDETTLLRRTVLVADGTYDRIQVRDRQVTLVAPGQGAIITPLANNEHVVSVASINTGFITSLSAEGFTIRDGGGSGIGVFCSTITSAHPSVHLTRSIVTNNAGGGISANNCIMTVENSSISANAGRAVSTTHSALTMDSNVISQNAGGGISVTSSVIAVVNNVIVLNGTPSGDVGGVWINQALGDSLFEFNTIANNVAKDDILVFAGINCLSAFPIRSSIIYENSPNDLSPACTCSYCHVTGDADPLFVGGGDYHLQASSPCIDGADPGATLGHDIDGEVRPQGAGYDIGADEAG